MLEKLKSVLQNLFGKKKKDNNIRMPANLTAAEQKEIKSIIENARKDRSVPHTAQDSIPFDRMFSDGIRIECYPSELIRCNWRESTKREKR